ncbi:dynein intermediate chain 2, ciliary-like [Schistocerca cancellata]|uniref:dynein intermediate chain 2, ciliary-like n=1 Tax=Schistocerca cancellata TaxID=274614 RepID=UPI00211972D5|nr:dynein intermediate chain 2, ciliary-like [Schistocerca cancellata]
MQSKSAYTAAKAQSKINDPSRQSIKHARQADAGDLSARKSRPAIAPGGRRHGNSGVAVGAKLLLKPDDQLELTDEELKDEVTRVLTSNHAQIVTDLVEYSYKEGRYVVLPSTGATFIIFRTEGTILHKDSDEARQQLFGEGGGFEGTPSQAVLEGEAPEEEAAEKVPEEGAPVEPEEGAEEEQAEGEEKEGEAEAEPKAEAEAEGEGDEEGEKKEGDEGGGPKKNTNQFNFCERSALTYNNPSRDATTQTIPPPRSRYSALVSPSMIFDIYQEDYALQQQSKEIPEEIVSVSLFKKPEPKQSDIRAAKLISRQQICAKKLERLVNQNENDEIAQDFRYWEDPSDQYKEVEGNLLPLWKFVYENTKKNHVTGVCWNPQYYDFFAVSFGYFDSTKPQPEGAMCLFTLKNHSYPEYICLTDTGVVCVDVHPDYPSMIVVGLYDGNVAVYNASVSDKEPARKSHFKDKHGGIVWQVLWVPDLPDGEMSFFSVSEDGTVRKWIIGLEGLAKAIVLTLTLARDPVPGPYGTTVSLVGSGTTMVFHPKEKQVFLVGTEEGHIYKCSTMYTASYLMTYNAHNMAVYRIHYNKYNSDIFVSCSADWTVKIWEDKRSDPLYIFDLGNPVQDVEWAPYSSTVFAAITDGRVHVFDLNIDKYRPICVQFVVSARRNRLSKITFNYKIPALLVGDERGCVTSLKISPNLRKRMKPPKKGPQIEPRELEIMKLDKLLSFVREPDKLVPPPDVPDIDY